MSKLIIYLKYKFKAWVIKTIYGVPVELVMPAWFVTNDKYLENHAYREYTELIHSTGNDIEKALLVEALTLITEPGLHKQRVQELLYAAADDKTVSIILHGIDFIKLTHCFIRDKENAACLLVDKTWLFFHIDTPLVDFIKKYDLSDNNAGLHP